MSAVHGKDPRLPLHALLSQVLVAFTVEFDNEFERQMGHAGYAGARLSLVVWSNLIRFVAADGVSVRDLTTQALASDERIRHQLGCLERWGFITLQPGKRDGWGSGRGIRADWIVRLAARGRTAKEIWPPLFGAIEDRWIARFGDDAITRLRESLQAVVSQLNMELPRGLAEPTQLATPLPVGTLQDAAAFPLPTLLSQVLMAYAIEFDRESTTPLALCANTIRVLSRKPQRVEELPRLTGASPETCGIGWQLKPYIVVENDPAKRAGKLVRLSPGGMKAQQTYHRLTEAIEQRWEEKFGKANIREIRESLPALFAHRSGDRPTMSAVLSAPPGVARSATQTPALGRRSVGSAARQRMRDLVIQTEAFVHDPAGSLPHYPLWDMNRGFGP